MSLILSPFVPRGQIEKYPEVSQGAIRGQNALICPQNPLHSYTITYTYPPLIIEENGDKMGNLSPSRTVTGLRAPLVLSPVCFNLSPILNFVPGLLYDWPQGGDKFVPLQNLILSPVS